MLDRTLFDQIYRYCCSLTGDEDRAGDLLQAAFEKYLRSGGAVAEVSKFYLMRIARNQFIDDWRKSSRIEVEPFDDETYLDLDIATLEQTIVDQDTFARLWRRFDPLEREILFLWAVEGYTTAEVARWLGLSRGTVLSRISRLRKRVNEYDEEVA